MIRTGTFASITEAAQQLERWSWPARSRAQAYRLAALIDNTDQSAVRVRFATRGELVASLSELGTVVESVEIVSPKQLVVLIVDDGHGRCCALSDLLRALDLLNSEEDSEQQHAR